MLGSNCRLHFNHVIKPVTHAINLLIIFMTFTGNDHDIACLGFLHGKFNCFTAVMNFMDSINCNINPRFHVSKNLFWVFRTWII